VQQNVRQVRHKRVLQCRHRNAVSQRKKKILETLDDSETKNSVSLLRKSKMANKIALGIAEEKKRCRVFVFFQKVIDRELTTSADFLEFARSACQRRSSGNTFARSHDAFTDHTYVSGHVGKLLSGLHDRSRSQALNPT